MNLRMKRPLWAAMLMVTVCPHALAQEETARQEVIIVSGPGPSRAASELIGNATSLDRADLIENLSGTLGDTLDSQPGVSTSFFGAGASRPILRGLGAERVLVLTNGIGTIDVSASSPDHQVASDGIDAERIEILRGPAALAYGGQAIGGVVNVIDGLIAEEIPEKKFNAEAFSAYNSANNGSEFAANTKFVAGNFVFALSASQRDFEDYDIPGFAESERLRASETEEDHDHEDEDHDDHEEEGHDAHEEEIYGSLENSFLETNTISGGVSWVGSNAFFGVAVRNQTSTYGIPGHSHDHEEHDDEDHEDEDHDEHEEEGHDEHEEELPFIDLEQTRIDIRTGLNLGTTGLTKILFTASHSDYEHTEFEAPGEIGSVFENEGTEARLEIDHSINGIEGAFGLQFSEKDLVSLGEEAFITPTSHQNIGAFLYETKDWENGFGIEGGARYEKTQIENNIQGEREFDLYNFSVGTHKHWENGWFVGGQLGYSERAPNENELYAYGPHVATSQFEIGDSSLDKESAINIEGALRWENDATRIGLNVFVNQFDQFIYLAPQETLVDGVFVDEIDEFPVYSFTQEDAEFTGGEIYIEHFQNNGLFNADWELKSSLEYVNAELDSGESLPFMPPLTLNASADANWNAFNVGLDVVVADSQSDSGAGYLDTDGYTSLNFKSSVDLAQLGVSLQNAEIFLDVQNITDEEIRHSTSVLKDIVPDMGRNFRFGFRMVL